MVPHDVSLCMSITSFISHNNPETGAMIIFVLGTQDTKELYLTRLKVSHDKNYRPPPCLAIFDYCLSQGRWGHSLKLLGINHSTKAQMLELCWISEII